MPATLLKGSLSQLRVRESAMPTEPPLEYPDASQAHSPENTFRVLFLDKAAHVDRMKESCKDVGYVVIGAETIVEAMAFLHGKDHVDVIVCGAHLESESMFAFLQEVRANKLHQKSTFLILSLESGAVGARLDRTASRAGMALGADAYTIMPVFDAPALIAQIRQMQPDVPKLQGSSPSEKLRSS